jgi:hypothetical protein
MADRVDLYDALVDRSSLGEAAVKRLRAKTPSDLADRIVALAASPRGFSEARDIRVAVTTTRLPGKRDDR